MKDGLKLCRLSELSFQASVELWNAGFAGYYADMTRSLNQHLKSFGAANIHPEYSVAAFADGEPAGFVLTALRSADGRKLAWNGGTAIVPRYRGSGIGKAMMREAIRIYRELDVDEAQLEAITANEAAVALYSRCGYRIRDRLLVLSLPPEPKRAPLFLEKREAEGKSGGAYKLLQVPPSQTSHLPFYRASAAWCSQWRNIADGEAAIVIDGRYTVAGYALYRRMISEDGVLKGVHVLQAEIDPGRSDVREAASFLLAELYGPREAEMKRTAENLPASGMAAQLLLEAGFEAVFEQYAMALELEPDL